MRSARRCACLAEGCERHRAEAEAVVELEVPMKQLRDRAAAQLHAQTCAAVPHARPCRTASAERIRDMKGVQRCGDRLANGRQCVRCEKSLRSGCMCVAA